MIYSQGLHGCTKRLCLIDDAKLCGVGNYTSCLLILPKRMLQDLKRCNIITSVINKTPCQNLNSDVKNGCSITSKLSSGA